MPRLPLPTSILAVCLLSAIASAQTTLFTLPGYGAGTYGRCLAAAGDVDGDGRPDFMFADPAVNMARGLTTLASGYDGRTLASVGGVQQFSSTGFTLASAGDADGDGFLDLVIGAPNEAVIWGQSGRVRIFSGLTGQQIRLYEGVGSGDQYGAGLVSVGDLDGDGADDLLIGIPRGVSVFQPATGGVEIRSGMTGAVLRTHATTIPGTWYGVDVENLGDVDGDGTDDYVIAAPGPGFGAPTPGRVVIHSGATGAVLFDVPGPSGAGADWFGWSICNGGDLTGDGIDDLVVGAPQSPATGAILPGYVAVVSGATGAIAQTFSQGAAGGYGWTVGGGQDVTGDGTPDVLVYDRGASVGPNGMGANAGPGRLWCVDGATFTNVPGFNLGGTANDDMFGESVTMIGDLTGDGASEFAYGIPASGLVRVASLGALPTASAATTVAGCGVPSAPTLSLSGPPVLGALISADVAGTAGVTGFLVLSPPPPAPVPVGGVCLVAVSLDPATWLTFPFLTAVNGTASVPLPIPSIPSAAGATAAAQAVLTSVAPLGGNLTNGLDIVLGY